MFWAALMVVWAVSVSSSPATVSGSPAGVSPATQAKAPRKSGPRKSGPPKSAQRCETTKDKDDITITCNYPKPPSASNRTGDLTVAVNRAVFSFEPTDSSDMKAELTFTNIGATPISQARGVYLEIDDDAGNNLVRRLLPTVDFRRLQPGQSLTFSEELRIAAFVPGHYRIQLWIPDPDKFRMFNPAHNSLLGNTGMADSATRLNVLADFTVTGFHR